MLDEQFKLSYATRNWLFGFIGMLNFFFLLRIYNEAFPLYNYLLTYANFN